MTPRSHRIITILVVAVLCLCAWGSLWFLKWHYFSAPWINSLAFSPDGKTLAGAGGWKVRHDSGRLLGILWLWDAQTGARKMRLVTGREFLGYAAFTGDGSTVAAAQSNGKQFFWNAANGRLLKTKLPGPNGLSFSLSESRALSYAGAFPCRPVSSGCRMEAQEQVAFDHLHRKALEHLDWMSGKIHLSALQDSGRYMAVAQWFEKGEKMGFDMVVKDIATGSVKAKYPFSSSKFYLARFSPDGESLLIAQIGNSGTELVLWHYKAQKILRFNDYEVNHPFTAAFSPDGKRVAVGGLYGEVQLWDTQSGKSLAQWKGS